MNSANTLIRFPKWRFTLASVAILAGAATLSFWSAQDQFKQSLNNQFLSFSEKTNSEIASIISLHQGVGANMLTMSSIEEEFNSNLRVYIDEISKHRSDLVFFILPKVADSQLSAFEQKKQDLEKSFLR